MLLKLVESAYQFIANYDHVQYHVAKRVLGVRVGVDIQEEVVNGFVGAARGPGQWVLPEVG